ncbi:WD repeat-containing protein WRAP [Acrasis kona]|uniref:WD repeat-containing protein WRAP n=1 Tax=Acrasis kona TaxID=1008807 RepID=A0AAW2ZB67_9EUKA
MQKRGTVEVWSLTNPKWKCKIEEGPAGISDARFSPDSAHVLITSEFQLRITVWSLFDDSANHAHIKSPKYSGKGLDFRIGGEYMALAERRECKDFISIIFTPTWELVQHFPAHTKNLQDLKWSPDGRYICAWDSSLDFSVCIYDMSGSLVKQYEAYKNALAVKANGVSWSPSGQLLAVGCYDQKVYILNSLTWNPIGEYRHDINPSPQEYPTCCVFREIEYKATHESQNKTRYELEDLPTKINVLKPDYKKPNPKVGVGIVEWSANSQYMCTRNDNMPNTLWIWETGKLSLVSLLIQLNNIKCVAWHPTLPYLAICTGNNKIYTWYVHSTSCVDIPGIPFKVQRLKWNKDGSVLLLMDENTYCCCYVSGLEEIAQDVESEGEESYRE